MTVSILSDDARRKAVVTMTADGARADYYKINLSGRANMSERALRPTSWRYLRSTEIREPFHRALDIAHRVVNAG